MEKEVISDNQGISLTILTILGTSVIIVMGLDAKQDIWLANILSILMASPLLLIYARLHYIFQGKDLFDILTICLGKFIGKIISILYIWFAFHIGALIISDYGYFITVVSLKETPKITPIIFIVLLGFWGVKQGIEVLGRWTEFFIPIIIFFILTTILFSIPNMKIDNIRPMLYNGIKPVIKGAFYSFAFPFVETVLLTMFFCNFQTRKSPYKVYISGLMIGGIVLVLLNLTNILVLGVNTASSLYYPSYFLSSTIGIKNVFQRLEMISAIVFLLGGYIKMSISLMVVCKGVSKIFNCVDYRFIVTPISLLLGFWGYTIYDNAMQVLEFATSISPYYKFSFQVIIPIIIWIISERKKKNIAM